MKFEQIAVVGAGLLGTNIALDFALAGRRVTLTDRDAARLEQARSASPEALEPLATAGLLRESPEAIIDRIIPVTALSDAVGSADLVIEAVFEDLELKRQVFTELDRLAPTHAVLASNSSSLMPSLLAAATTRPERVLGAHYWNPAHLVPLVELIPSPNTDPALVEALRSMYVGMGKQPVVVRRETPGFIGNRLQFALLREALALVEAGVADPTDIDTVVRAGFGRRLPVTGIFGTADLAGLDTLLAICGVLFPELASVDAPGPALREQVVAGRTGVKSGAGWYEYPGEAAATARRRLYQALAAALAQDRSDTEVTPDRPCG